MTKTKLSPTTFAPQETEEEQKHIGTDRAAKLLMSSWEAVGQEQLLSINFDRTVAAVAATSAGTGMITVSPSKNNPANQLGTAAFSDATVASPSHSPEYRRSSLPTELTLVAGVVSFLATLKGQSVQTQKTYRVGCRRFMWFIYASERGDPTSVTIYSLSPFVLEDFYLWLVEQYGREARTTMAGYLAASRNLFEYLARRRLTPQGAQYQEMVAGLSKLQGRASYRTPRTKGKQVAQVVRLLVAKAETKADEIEAATSNQNKDSKAAIAQLNSSLATSTTSANTNESNVTEAGSASQKLNDLTTAPPHFTLNENSTEAEETAGNNVVSTDGQRLASRKGWAAKSDKEKARQHLEEVRDRAIILTLYTTGMRRQELMSLNRAELELLLMEAYLQPVPATFGLPTKTPESEQKEADRAKVWELLITGKGNKERIIYFDKATLEAISLYLTLRGKDNHRPLFLQHHRNRDLKKPGPNGQNYRLSLIGVWSVVHKYGKILGVDLKPHDFRHNLATTLLNAGAQLSEVQDILGHANPATTKMIYAHYDKGHLKEAFSRYRATPEEL